MSQKPKLNYTNVRLTIDEILEQKTPDHPLVEQFLERNKTRFSCPLCKGKHHIYFCKKLDICIRFNCFTTLNKRPDDEANDDFNYMDRPKICDSETCKFKHICSYCLMKDHNSQSCPNRPKFCKAFNNKVGCYNKDCFYAHVCRTCGEHGHSAKDCLMKFKSKFNVNEPWQSTNWKTPSTSKTILLREDQAICHTYNKSEEGCKDQYCQELNICLICKGYHPAYLCLSMKAACCFVYNAVYDECVCKTAACSYLHNCFNCGSSEHSSPNCRKRDSYCNKYNHPSKPCEEPHCKYKHVCKTCEGQHSAIFCPFNFQPMNPLKVLGQTTSEKKREMRGGASYSSSNIAIGVKRDRNNSSGQWSQSQGQWGDPNQPPSNKIGVGNIGINQNQSFQNRQHFGPMDQNPNPMYNQPDQNHRQNTGNANNSIRPNLPQSGSSYITSMPNGGLMTEMNYSVVINGIKWSGVLTREN